MIQEQPRAYVQTPVFALWQIPKSSAKTREKAMSAESLKALAADKAVIIPHIVINVTEEGHLRMDELLRNASLPTLDQVRCD